MNQRLAILVASAGLMGYRHAELADASGQAASAAQPGVNPTLIKVDVNPTAQQIQVQVETKMVEMKEASFSFRTVDVVDPDLGLDEKGNPKTRPFKRPTLKFPVPLLTRAGVIAAIQAEDKTTDLVIDSVNDLILNRVRGIIQDKIEVDPSIVLKSEDVPIEQLSLAVIASLPRSARGAGIAKEAFQAFVADYKAVMGTPEAIELFADKKPRSPEILDKHAILLAGKFNQVKSRKDVVGQMLGFLNIWVQVTQNGEEHLTVYEFLVEKANAIMAGESFDDL